MPTTSKITSFELARVIGIIAIISIHCQLFMSIGLVDGSPWLNYITNQLARFAVPLFFTMSGYLIAPKLCKHPIQTAKRYCLPLLKLWVSWSIVCLLVPFNFARLFEQGYLAERKAYWDFLLQTPLNSLLEGGLVHLWFLPSLIIAVYIIALLVHTKMIRALIPIAIACYVYGVLAGSYAQLTELEAPIFTRNGPFFSLLCVAIGFEIKQRNLALGASNALRFATLGLLVHFAEAWWLNGHGQIFSMNDFLFGTVIWSTGLFMYLLAKPSIGNNSVIKHFSQWTLPIYVNHLVIIILLFNIAGILGLHGLPKDIFVFVTTLVLSYLLARLLRASVLSKLLDRT